MIFFFFSSRRRHTRWPRDWSSDVCSSDLMPLALEEVRRIAELARIGISDAEARAVRAQLNDIFELIGQMQKVDTDGIEPMTHAQGSASRLREDAVIERDRREQFQAVAPQVERGLYLVPKVIE